MSSKRKISAIAFCGALTLAHAASAQSGTTTWPPWVFDWEVKDGAGLALRRVFYQGENVLYKASLPVIRVQYQNDACGPFADQIKSDNLLSIPWCGGDK